MSDEQELPGIPPPPPTPRAPLFKRLFGRWKWPGWATLSLGLVRAFHLSEDVDFALSILRSLGGELGMVATVIASPFFAVALVGYGVLHLVFVGEPKQATRHYAWTYLGWAIFGICLVSVVGTVGYGLVEVAIEKEVGKRDEQLQQQYASRPTYWHLTDVQKAALTNALAKVSEQDRFQIQIVCLPDAGSRTYVEEFAKILVEGNWKVNANCFFSTLRPDFTGMAVVVSPALAGKPIKDGPRNVQTLAQILSEAQISFVWSLGEKDMKEDELYLAVGNAP